MKALTIAWKVVLTGAAIALAWSLAVDPYLPGWAAVSAIALIAFVWSVVMLRSSVLVPSLYALACFLVIFLGACFFTAAVEMACYDYRVPGWTVVLFFAFVVAVWLLVLWRRVSLKWPAIAALVLLALPFGILAIGIVKSIGLGKLVVHSVGRTNVYAASHMRVGFRRASPRGLVE